MASSNRHWPSMFKSKPCTNTSSAHHQWHHHDINNPSSLVPPPPCSNLNPYSSSGCAGYEERTPEPKPRWNPRPEQIRILEAIFNSGMVNPPRDEIRKIRAQLQEYGQVGDANVFYWFQNRKSRSKHKQRQLQNAKSSSSSLSQLTTKNHPPPPVTANNVTAFIAAPSPNSSSSSDKSSNNNSNDKSLSIGVAPAIDLLNSPTASVNQPFLQGSNDFLGEPFFFPAQHNAGGSTTANVTQGFCFPDVGDQCVENCPNFLLSELMLMSNFSSKKEESEKMKQQNLSFAAPPTVQSTVPQYLSVPSSNFNPILQGVGEVGGTTKTTTTTTMVFINDVCLEVGMGLFNVREAFGEDAVLVQSSGQAVVTNEWGLTVHPLQHGAFYYLFRQLPPTPNSSLSPRTIDLI